MTTARATVIVFLPIEQDVDADESEALAVASADAEGLGGALRETEALLLAVARKALDGAPHARLGMPAMTLRAGDAREAVERLRALLSEGR